MQHEFEQVLARFTSSFELVFGNDWDHTKANVADEYFVSDGGTFVNPGVQDESNNWANRGSLLTSYRRLREMMDEFGFEIPDPSA